jgi:hypothetical protein
VKIVVDGDPTPVESNVEVGLRTTGPRAGVGDGVGVAPLGVGDGVAPPAVGVGVGLAPLGVGDGVGLGPSALITMAIGSVADLPPPPRTVTVQNRLRAAT